MTETFLAFDLAVTCVDGSEHTSVELKISDDTVIYITPDGKELRGAQAVKTIESGNFVTAPNVVAQAIEKYRSQD